ncbi:hypothetical protein IEQ34_007305 [Dendrobium chrysotoxum]|uniref:Uncharacterized protein n=1 Tax=Dendrobium chrysotoxum TaxID=161865 RepID=A0AAV7GST8_DENCH|nr:hypothetical protein IEQ34_007305 [Dendrobium chrysotoxum]
MCLTFFMDGVYKLGRFALEVLRRKRRVLKWLLDENCPMSSNANLPEFCAYLAIYILFNRFEVCAVNCIYFHYAKKIIQNIKTSITSFGNYKILLYSRLAPLDTEVVAAYYYQCSVIDSLNNRPYACKPRAEPSTQEDRAEEYEICRLSGEIAGCHDVDWTRLLNDTVVQLSLASAIATKPASLLLAALGASLVPRCAFGIRLTSSLIAATQIPSPGITVDLHAHNLWEIAGDYCCDITDVMLSVITARHKALESLQIGLDPCEKISNDAIRHVAICCSRLRRLCLLGIRELMASPLAPWRRTAPGHANVFVEIALLDCENIDETALGKVECLKLGSRNLKWASNVTYWSKLPNLVGLDVSRTNILTLFTDISKRITSLFSNSVGKETEISRNWRSQGNKDKNLNELISWGVALLLSLENSSRENVQERAAAELATFVVIDDENAIVDPARAEAVMKNGGIMLLLELARSCREGVQSEATKAIANLSVNAKVAKAILTKGGISILAALARFTNRLVAEGLWNLSVGEEHKTAIAEAGGVKAQVDLIFKWPTRIDGVLEHATGALANLAADEQCSMEVAMASGVHALVMLARSCRIFSACMPRLITYCC